MINKGIIYEKQKGISLIALVITIIVLLILTGVALNLIVGKENVISRADSTVVLQEKTEIVEYLTLAVSAINIDYLGNNKVNTFTSYFTDYNDYKSYSTFVANTDFDTSMYQITNYEVAGENTNKYVDISIKKSKGTEEVHRFIIRLGSDTNAENGEFADGVEETLALLEIGEISEIESNIKVFNINYMANGGTVPADAKRTYKKGQIQQYSIPTYEGYIFDGWYENNSFTGEKVTSTKSDSDGDITIYAKWISETNSDYFTWNFENDVATITGLSTEGNTAYENGELSTLVIPQKYSGTDYSANVGKSVTQIGESAFNGKTNINKLIIGDQVTSIGPRAFKNCSGITELKIPITVNSNNYSNYTSDCIFYGCSNINKVTLTKGDEYGVGFNYTTSGSTKYEYTPWYISKANLQTVILEEGITTIGTYTFCGCTGLQAVSFPSTLTSIGDYAVKGCSGLGQINLPNNVTTIGNYAFENCTTLAAVTFPNSVTSIGNGAFKGCTGISNTIQFPNSITSLNAEIFMNCTSIEKAIIGEQITSVSNRAFSGCTGLSELTIPISVNAVNFSGTVDQSIFYNCKNLTKVNFLKGTGVGFDYPASSSGRVEYSPWVLSKKNEITVTLAEGITSIGTNMFYGCTGLKTINFPNSLTKISDSAFYNCSGLTLNNLDLPDTITNIEQKAFYGCVNITGTVEIPVGMTTISNDTFCGCSGIQKVIIGDQITSIGPRAFKNCTELSEVILPITINADNFNNSVSDSIFYGCAKIAKIRLSKGQDGTGFTYTTSGSTRYDYTPWYISKSNLQTIILEKGINSIGNYTFNGLNNTTSFYYTGTDTEWEKVQSNIGANNAPLTNATVTCNYSE